MPSIALPGLRGTSQQVLYPVTRTVSCMTQVDIMWNGSERRKAQRAPLYGFELPMRSLSVTDKAAMLSLLVSAKGEFETTLALTMAAVTYNDLTLLSDALEQVASHPLVFDQTLRLSQVKSANPITYVPPTVGGTYPTLSFGAVAEYPFSQVSTFLTSMERSRFGQKIKYQWYGASLANFPTGYLRNWKIEYPLITDADLATLETYLLGKRGRYKSFDFVDPVDGSTYHHVRFDMDDLVVRHLTANQNSTSVILHQTFNS